ncbi:hypothetical protein PTKIN_Ptkin16aG0492500 [Pterospermum kingtungense]
MVLQHFSHRHPLVFIEERSNESEKVHCSGCGEMVSGPTFSCVDCGFHLHKQCAEAPCELIHPFHRSHSFSLLQRHPYKQGRCLCDFCDQTCETFVYHCSCGLDLHIKCALFSYNIAEKGIEEFQHIAHVDPLISTENRPEKLKNAQCFACWKPLLDSVYFSPDCGFYLHVTCVALPAEINHFLHPQHPLVLQFNSQRLSCHICQKPQRRGLVYSCSSPCNFVLHIGCAIPTKLNQLYYHRKHPLTLQLVDEPLPCHICQKTEDTDTVCSLCSICKFVLHVRCASLSPVIEDKLHHEHHFSLLPREVSLICDACAQPYFYHAIDSIETDEAMELSFEKVAATSIKHFSHDHNLTLCEEIVGDKQCDGCLLSILASCYYCSQCDFFLHKSCAELPMKKHIWSHFHQRLLRLTSGYIFRCQFCYSETSGFAYTCDECNGRYCLGCALLPDIHRCEGHEHPLPFFRKFEGSCNACGDSITAAFRCKSCNFNLDGICLRLPLIA